jgi:hypothetical protein
MGAARGRLLRAGLAVIIAGFACGVASATLSFAWAYTRAGGLSEASWWLTWLARGCFAIAVACAVLQWRLRAQEARMLHDTRPRPDYALIAAMETEIWGHPFHHAGAPWRCEWPAWCAPGREAEAAEILRAFGIHVTRVTGHPAIPDGEVIVVNPDSGYQPGYGSNSAPGRGGPG